MGQLPVPVDPLIKGELGAMKYLEELRTTMSSVALVDPERYAAEYLECVLTATLAQIYPLTKSDLRDPVGAQKFLIAVGAYTTFVRGSALFLERRPLWFYQVLSKSSVKRYSSKIRKDGFLDSLSIVERRKVRFLFKACLEYVARFPV